MTANRLANQTSPYLLQHANNPVSWYPWGIEAHQLANTTKKPILLSIGYSACHWCHVMAHESFEDLETAKLMNELFINIKVDKEERPDLDKIYQISHQLLTGRAGGWPLTVFLTHDTHIPFFIGTYFPKDSKQQLPAFKDLLIHLAAFYNEHPTELISITQEVSRSLNQINLPALSYGLSTILTLEPWNNAIRQLIVDYDHDNGGFGGAPKFPRPSLLQLLIYDALSADSKNKRTLSAKMLHHTLIKMGQRGIYDQIQGGFYRYAVDQSWEIPHFEKMLYDNAELLSQYAMAQILFNDPSYIPLLTQTSNWLLSEMQSLSGGFYSALDADSEGKEGYFYLWTKSELQTILTHDEYATLEFYYNLQAPPNFENCWHLNITHTIAEVAKYQNQSLATTEKLIKSAQHKLLMVRNQRISPFKDTKILTSWNALIIKSLVLTGMALQNPYLITVAEKTLNFVKHNLWRDDCLLACYKDGTANLSGYLDDYAFLLDAVLTLLQYRWSMSDFSFAQSLATALLTHFYDHQHGGFFFVADNHEPLIYRPKIFADEATPAGNSIACYALQRLGYLTGDAGYLNIVKQSLIPAWPDIIRYPQAYASLLIVLREYLEPPNVIIIRGEIQSLLPWRELCYQHYSPKNLFFFIENNQQDLFYTLTEKKPSQYPIAYVCKGTTCLAPITTLDELKAAVFE